MCQSLPASWHPSTIAAWRTTEAGARRLGRERTGRSATSSTSEGSGEVQFSRETVEKLLASGGFFWLDLDQPDADDFEILRDVFEFHPLAIEDSEHFGQRAKIDDYDDFVFIVVYGAAPDDDRLVEVHCFYSRALPRHRPPRRLPRVRRDPASATRSARRRSSSPRCCSTGSSTVSSTASSRSSPTSTTGSTSSRTRSSCRADDQQLQEIFQMKRLLVGMRKAVTPQRDTFARADGRRRRSCPGWTRRTSATSATSTTT